MCSLNAPCACVSFFVFAAQLYSADQAAAAAEQEGAIRGCEGAHLLLPHQRGALHTARLPIPVR
jgi:hypothetical protein